MAQLFSVTGLAVVAIECFRRGEQRGFAIRGQTLAVQIEHPLRCTVMTAVVFGFSAFLGAAVDLFAYELFWRR